MSDWMSLQDAATAMQGNLVTGNGMSGFNSISIDSRNISEDGLFFAIKGERFDGHDFVADLQDKCAGIVVDRELETSLPQIVVDDVLLALGQFAKSVRQQFDRPLVALTGSNGKTTLKEMLTSILSVDAHVLATQGNLNNHIGVPLTLSQLREHHDYAVIEMGANHAGEIDYLTKLAMPDVAIINNAGNAHIEGFGSLEGVARAKGEIFLGLGTTGIAVINADDQFADYWSDSNAGREVITFGMNNNDAMVVGDVSSEGLTIRIGKDEIRANLKLLGRHNAMNALAASAVSYALGLDLLTIKTGLERLQPVKGRLCPVDGIQGISILDDTYNANPDSTAAALKVLSERKPNIFVLGDMGELGEASTHMHAGIGQQANELGISAMYCLGELSQHACEAFGDNAHGFMDVDDLLMSLKSMLQPDMTVLIKGSRTMRMERVVQALAEQGGAA